LRDLLIGGDQTPLTILADPNWGYIIGIIVVTGSLLSYFGPPGEALKKRLVGLQRFCETVGLAVLTVAGAQVAIVAGREAKAFQGRFFEELVLVAGLLMAGLLHLANYMFDPQSYVIWVTVFVLAFVLISRIILVKTGIRSPPRLQ
jgi:hypothetical protein